MKEEYTLNYIYEDNKEEYVKAIEKDFYIPKDCCVEQITNGIVVPSPARDKLDYPIGFGHREGGCVDANGAYVQSSARRLLRYNMNYVNPFDISEVPYIDETVCCLGPVAGYWGHILTEICCCLYYAIQHKNMKWVYWDYADPKIETIREPLLQFLQLFGIGKEHLVAVTSPTRFQKVIVPEVSAILGEYYTDTYKAMFDYLRDTVCNKQNAIIEKIKDKKIYLTKSEFESAKDNQIGEKAIKEVFEKNGYLCVSPEKLSISEQIILFSEASEIAAIEGTLPHNILFCNDGIKLTIINRRSGINFYQLTINQIRKADVTYIDCWYMLLPIYQTGPYIYTINENMKRYVCDRGMLLEDSDDIYTKDYYKLFWYILQYLDIYDLHEQGKQLQKVWTKESVNDYLMSRKAMSFLDSNKSKDFKEHLKQTLLELAK